jgi:hypothetical protein
MRRECFRQVWTRHVESPTNGAAGWLVMGDGTPRGMVNLSFRTALWRQAMLYSDTSLDMTSAAVVAFGRVRGTPYQEVFWPTPEASGNFVHSSRPMWEHLARACFTVPCCPNNIMYGKGAPIVLCRKQASVAASTS